MAATHAGMTTEEFSKIVKDWIATAKHPKTGQALHRDGLSADARTARLSARERLQDLHRLRRRHRVHAPVDGEGLRHPARAGRRQQRQDEVRDARRQAGAHEAAEINFIDDKAGKPVGIQHHIGRRPIAAFGNSDGDLQMLQWTAAGSGPRFCLYVHHTDAEREWAYDRKSHIGKLDKGLDEAKAKGWTVVSMKDDWKTIYP